LAKLVVEGKFRQDLFYRINVMQIGSPPLREHPEDIPAIAMHFLLRYAQIFQKSMSSIAPGALELLQSYSWPGNVRELENVMQRSIIAAAGSTIRADDLGLGPQDEDEPEFKDVLDIGDYHPAGSFDRQIQDYKVKLVLSTLRESNGNKTLAARKLGISRVYLHRLIRLTEAGLVLEQPAKDQEIPESGVA
jgi:transcriptional regulator with PAS, ATPase and Fis domain